MLPMPETRVWSSSSRLMPAVRRRTRATNSVVVERAGRTGRGRCGRSRPAARRRRRRPTGRRTSAGRRTAARGRRGRSGPAGGARRGAPRLLDEQLAAHAEVGEQGVAVVERQPEVLAAAPGGLEPAAGERRGEAGRAAEVAADRARVEDLTDPIGAADHVRSRPSRTVSTSGSSGTSVGGVGRRSVGDGVHGREASSPYAVSAAACSASFLERPTPLP